MYRFVDLKLFIYTKIGGEVHKSLAICKIGLKRIIEEEIEACLWFIIAKPIIIYCSPKVANLWLHIDVLAVNYLTAKVHNAIQN